MATMIDFSVRLCYYNDIYLGGMMKLNIVRYLLAQAAKLKDQLPNDDVYNREHEFKAFKRALHKFNDFEIIAFNDNNDIIITKDGIHYRTSLVSENQQIKVIAHPYDANKQTQVNANEAIIVATTPYDNSDQAKIKAEITKALIDHILNLIAPKSNHCAFCLSKIKERMLGDIIPAFLAQKISTDPSEIIVTIDENSCDLLLDTGQKLHIEFLKSNDEINQVICSYQIESHEGIVHVTVANNNYIKVEDYDGKPSLGVGWRSKLEVTAELYDQDAINVISRVSGQNLSNQPNIFKEAVNHYGFEPDQILKISIDRNPNWHYITLNSKVLAKTSNPTKLISDLITATFTSNPSFDDLVKAAYPKYGQPEPETKKSFLSRGLKRNG